MSPLTLCCDSLPMNLVLFLFQVGSLPSTAPTDYAFSQPSFPVFPVSLPYSGVLHVLPLFPAPTASVFCKLIHTRFHALMRYSNSTSIPIIVTSPNLWFFFHRPTSALPTPVHRTIFATSPYLVVAHPLWSFTTSFVNNNGSWVFCRWEANFVMRWEIVGRRF